MTMSVHLRIAPLAESLRDFAGRHRGESIVVCGCGESLNNVPVKPACISLGVNDVGRHFDPDYLVVVNPPAQFPPDRRRAITESRAGAVFTQFADWRLQHAPRVPIVLGAYGGADFTNQNVLHYTRNCLCRALLCDPPGGRAHRPDRRRFHRRPFLRRHRRPPSRREPEPN